MNMVHDCNLSSWKGRLDQNSRSSLGSVGIGGDGSVGKVFHKHEDLVRIPNIHTKAKYASAPAQ